MANRVSPPCRVSCRPTRFPATTPSTPRTASPSRSSKPRAGRTGGATSSTSAKLSKAPIAAGIARRIDELFAIERAINGKSPEVRRAVRQERSKPLVAALESYMREQLGRLSPKNDLAKAIRYMLTRWPSFTRFLDDGRICLSTDDAEKRES